VPLPSEGVDGAATPNAERIRRTTIALPALRATLAEFAHADVVAIILGSVLALFATTGPAAAFFSGGLFLDVQVNSPAHPVGGGASVDVPVEVTCNARPDTS
jgi:hypothetical protein